MVLYVWSRVDDNTVSRLNYRNLSYRLILSFLSHPQKFVSTKVPSRRVTASVIDGTRTATTVAWSSFPVKINGQT